MGGSSILGTLLGNRQQAPAAIQPPETDTSYNPAPSPQMPQIDPAAARMNEQQYLNWLLTPQ